MSGSPHNGQAQGQGQGQTSNNPAFNPALLNANATLANFNPSFTNPNNAPNPSPFPNLAPSASITQQANFSPEQLARLTDFHRRSPQQHASPLASAVPAPPSQLDHRHRALLQIMPQTLAAALMAQPIPDEKKLGLIEQWGLTEQGREAIANARISASMQGSGSGGQGTISSPGQVFGRQLSGSPTSRPGGSPLPPQPRPFSNLTSPEKIQSSLQSPGQIGVRPPLPEFKWEGDQAKPLSTSTPAPPKLEPPSKLRTQAPAASNITWIRPPNAIPANAESTSRNQPRRQDGMRGSMRSECESSSSRFFRRNADLA